MLREPGHASRAQGADGRICEQNVVRDLAHHLGFERRGAGESDSASLELFGREPWRFVRLDVRPQAQLVVGCITSGAGKVALQAMEGDDGEGGLELGKEVGHRGCDWWVVGGGWWFGPGAILSHQPPTTSHQP